MIYYLAEVGRVYSPKNKLCIDIQGYLRSWDRKLIPAEKINEVKKEILQHIAEINKTFPRCKPVNASFWSPQHVYENDDHIISFDGESIICFSFVQGFAV